MIHETIYLYEGREDVTLTTYLLSDSPEMLAGRKRPAVLICPGGAYLGCSDREAEPVAMAFSAMGYHTFVLRYTTYGAEVFERGFEGMVPRKECRYPAPMQEIGLAMLQIKNHAKEWLVDENKVAICGFSAGAHNCAMYATHWHLPVITDLAGTEKERFRPAACMLGYCLSDYLYMKEYTNQDTGATAMFEVSNLSFLGEKKVSEERLLEVSPARWVTKETPPVFLWATAADELVPVQHSLRMAYALAEQEVPFEVHIFEEGGHGLSLATQASSAVSSQINADAAKWVEMADTWLKKRFAIAFGE